MLIEEEGLKKAGYTGSNKRSLDDLMLDEFTRLSEIV